MKTYKIIIAAILIIIPSYIVLADTSTLSNAEQIIQLKAIIEKNNKTIENLKSINQEIQTRIQGLSWTWIVVVKSNTGTIEVKKDTSTVTLSWAKATSVEKYNILIDKINSMSQDIFLWYWLWTGSSIWLFEFIEPSNFFISIDDGKNPEWVTAYKKKVLYSYDKDYNLKVDWTFDLDYASQYYVTKSWKNPFSKAIRIRVKNPLYKGKLLDISVTTTWTGTNSWTTSSTKPSKPAITTTNTTTASTVDTSNVTLADVIAAYNKNKVLDAIKLSNEYIKKDPNNLEVLKIRYRGYYMVWKYSEAFIEVQKYIKIKWDATEKSIYCEAKVIAKLNKSTDALASYTNLCSGKK